MNTKNEHAGFAEGWVTSGWSIGPDGRWIELGNVAGSGVCVGVVDPPELTIHGVADKLNSLEARCAQKNEVTQDRKLELIEEFGLSSPDVSEADFAALDGISNLLFGQRLLAQKLDRIQTAVNTPAERPAN